MQTSYFNDSSMFTQYPFEQNNNRHNVFHDQLDDSNANSFISFNQLQVLQNYIPFDNNNDELNQNYFMKSAIAGPSYHERTPLQTFFYDDSTATTTPSNEAPITSTFYPSEQPSQNNLVQDGLNTFTLAKPLMSDLDQYNSFPVISTDYSSESAFNSQPTQLNRGAYTQRVPAGQTNQLSERHQSSLSSYSIPSPTATNLNLSPLGTPLPSPSSTKLNQLQQNYEPASPISPKKLSSKAVTYSSRRSSVTSNKISKSYKARTASSSVSPPSKTTFPVSNSYSSVKHVLQHTTQPGPIPASKPKLTTDPTTGEELLNFSYSKQKIIKNFTIKCPPQQTSEELSEMPYQFKLDNCVYPRAMCSMDEYKGNRYQYEKDCNEIGWNLSWLNPEIRDHRGLIQRAVDSWRNTRKDKKLRSRRVRKSETGI